MCPKNEIFIKAFMHDLDTDEYDKLMDHILTCEKCRKKWEFLKQITSEMTHRINDLNEEKLSPGEEKQLRKIARQKLKEQKRKKKLNFSFSPAMYAVIVATLIVVIAGIVFITKMSQMDVYRKENKFELKLIAPSGKISSPPAVFTWTEFEGAEDYMFELIDDDLNTLYLVRVPETRLTLPEDVRQKLKKGKTYLWKVLAQEDDLTVLSSDHTYFELK
jgi:hypothetical protein